MVEPKSFTEVQALRAEVMKRHRAAGAKISRIRKKGMEIAGSDYDPRRPVAHIKHYNKKQLEAHLGRLNSFTDRSNNFVNSSGGAIKITRARYWARLIKQFNSIGQRHMKTFGGVESPTSGMTIEERQATLEPKNRKRSKGAATYNPFEPKSDDVSGMNGPVALEKMIKSLEKKLKPGFEQKEMTAAREQLNAMLDRIGGAASELHDLSDRLTDDQLNILWNYEQFANAISDIYEDYVKEATEQTEQEERWRESARNDYFDDAKEMLEWGVSIDLESKEVAEKSPEQEQKDKRRKKRTKGNQTPTFQADLDALS